MKRNRINGQEITQDFTMTVEVVVHPVGASMCGIITIGGHKQGVQRIEDIEKMLTDMMSVVQDFKNTVKDDPEAASVRMMKGTMDTRTGQVIREEEIGEFAYDDKEGLAEAVRKFDNDEDDDEEEVHEALHAFNQGMKVS